MLGAVSISDWRSSTTSATLSTRMPTTCCSDSMITILLESSRSVVGRPKRVRVSMTVTTLPRRLMMPST
jgi:hypothetical protein